MSRIIPVSLLIVALAAPAARAASLDIQNQLLDTEISKLTAEADSKMNDLNSCSKSVNGFRIAGIATLTATAGLGILDIVQHNKINALNDKIEAADQSIAATDKKISNKQSELDQQRAQNAQMQTYYYQVMAAAPTNAQLVSAQTTQNNANQLVAATTNQVTQANQTIIDLNQRQAEVINQTNASQQASDEAARLAAEQKAKADQLAADAAKKQKELEDATTAAQKAAAQKAADEAARLAAEQKAKADQLAADAARKKQEADAAEQKAKDEAARIAAEKAAAAQKLADAQKQAQDAAAQKARADAEAARLAKQKADAEAAKAAVNNTVNVHGGTGTESNPYNLSEATIVGTNQMKKPAMPQLAVNSTVNVPDKLNIPNMAQCDYYAMMTLAETNATNATNDAVNTLKSTVKDKAGFKGVDAYQTAATGAINDFNYKMVDIKIAYRQSAASVFSKCQNRTDQSLHDTRVDNFSRNLEQKQDDVVTSQRSTISYNMNRMNESFGSAVKEQISKYSDEPTVQKNNQELYDAASQIYVANQGQIDQYRQDTKDLKQNNKNSKKQEKKEQKAVQAQLTDATAAREQAQGTVAATAQDLQNQQANIKTATDNLKNNSVFGMEPGLAAKAAAQINQMTQNADSTKANINTQIDKNIKPAAAKENALNYENNTFKSPF